MNLGNSISITIKGKGKQKILSDNINTLPNILINNNPSEIDEDKYVKIQEDANNINNITLTFNEPLNNINGMFSNLNNIIAIDFSDFNTAEIIDMSYLFFNCTSLEYLYLNNIDTSKVKNMQYMFYNCKSLISLNISNFNTGNVEIMSFMFSGCNSLKYLDISNFNTHKVINMTKLFSNCGKLPYLDLTHFNTQNVIDMDSMFEYCWDLTSLDVSSFDTSKVTAMTHLFKNLNYLTSLNIDNFDTSSVEYMVGMLEWSVALTSLNLSKFDTSKVKSMWCMFCGATSLKFLNLVNFNTSSVDSMEMIFKDFYSLISLNIDSFNTNLVQNMYGMFQNCQSLISLNLRNFIFKEDVNIENMFTDINPNLIYSIGSSIPQNLLEILLVAVGSSDNSNLCFQNSENKFIIEELRCIDNCTNDNLYKFEYNNLCYISCPKRTNVLPGNIYLCKDLLCDKKDNYYYNFNQTLCISHIPNGFYLNDTIEKTIDECDMKCKDCKLRSNLCVSCNIDKGYYPILNNSLNNNNESFIDCYNELPKGYILDENIYKPCYFTCENCTGYGNEENNQCFSCKSNYNFISFENNTNCYQIWNFFFFLINLIIIIVL